MEMELPRTEEACKKYQLMLQQRICCISKRTAGDLKTIAGVDLAYWNEGDIEKAVCCIVVLDFATDAVLERQHTVGTISFPYIPGYLAFRELPLILETAKKLTVLPDLYMFDGNGYLHPRHMGIATHASFYLKTPSIGVAKSYYKIEDTVYETPAPDAGAYADILLHQEVYGRALRTHHGVKPVFVSIGNEMDLDTATEIVLACVRKDSHIPLPTRLADLDTHEMRTHYLTIANAAI